MPTDLVSYFRELTSERSVRAIAAKADIEQTTLNRQLSRSSALPVETVVAICRAYDLDLADVFVAVGFITEDEARRFGQRFALADFSDQELTREMVRRLDVGEAEPETTAPVDESIVTDVLSRRRAEKALREIDELPYLGSLTEDDMPKQRAADTKPRKGDDQADDDDH